MTWDQHFQPPGGVMTDEFWPAHRDALSAAAKKFAEDYTKLYTRYGTRAHLSPSWRTAAANGMRGVLCPVLPKWPDEWFGTGSQAEYEHAAELETCSRCRAAFMLTCRCASPECPCNATAGAA